MRGPSHGDPIGFPVWAFLGQRHEERAPYNLKLEEGDMEIKLTPKVCGGGGNRTTLIPNSEIPSGQPWNGLCWPEKTRVG